MLDTADEQTMVATPVDRAVRRPVSPVPLSLVPSSRLERGIAGVAVFFLTYNMPTTWLVKPTYGTIGTNAAAPTQLALLLAGLAIFALLTLRLDVGPFVDIARQEPLLPAFVGLIVASTLWSTQPDAAFRDGITIAGITVVGYWLVVRFPLRQIVGITAAAFAVGTVFQLTVISFAPAYGAMEDGWVGVFKNRNIFGRHLSLALLVFLIAARFHRRFRMALYGGSAVVVFMLLHANSKTSLVVSLVTPVMGMVFTAFRARRTLYGAVAITIVTMMVGAGFLVSNNLDTITEALDRQPNLSGRTEIWRWALPSVGERPLFGFGWHGFFTTDWAGPAHTVYTRLGLTAHAHNALLQYALTVGVVGAAIAVALYLRLIVRAARVVRHYQGSVGLFPLLYASYAVLNSVTEYGVIAPDSHFLLFVVAVAAAGPGRRDALTLNRSFVPFRPEVSSAL